MRWKLTTRKIVDLAGKQSPWSTDVLLVENKDGPVQWQQKPNTTGTNIKVWFWLGKNKCVCRGPLRKVWVNFQVITHCAKRYSFSLLGTCKMIMSFTAGSNQPSFPRMLPLLDMENGYYTTLCTQTSCIFLFFLSILVNMRFLRMHTTHAQCKNQFF